MASAKKSYAASIGIKLPRHGKAITAQKIPSREVYQALFKFCVRPKLWDLQVSSYHHIKRERPHSLVDNESFSAFLRRKLDSEREWQYHIDTAITPQRNYLVDLRGNQIVDSMCRYESLQTDFGHCCDRIGLAKQELPRRRRANDRTAYRDRYDEETKAWVTQHFGVDINVFGYEF